MSGHIRQKGQEMEAGGNILVVDDNVILEYMDLMPMDSLSNRMSDGFALMAVLRGSRGEAVDCEFKAVNEQFEKLTGFNAAEVVGRNLTEIVPESDATWIEICGRVASRKLKAKLKNFFSRTGRRLEIILYSPADEQVAAVLSDITLPLKTQT
jgi:hypothetical protein